jgi:hypothetical protein
MAAQKQLVRKIGKLGIEVVNAQMMRNARHDTMELIAEESLNHFLEGFQKGGYMTDASKSGWKRRKNDEDSTRAILVKDGDLWRDIDVQTVTNDLIVIGTKRIPYAAAHNEGLRITRRNFTMTKREFIGPTKALEVANENIVVIEMRKPLTIKKIA